MLAMGFVCWLHDFCPALGLSVCWVGEIMLGMGFVCLLVA